MVNRIIKYMERPLLIILIIIFVILIYKKNGENFSNYKSDIKYIFFTGGFDSTAILVNALLNTDYIVQPVYISDQNLDNIDTNNKRKNQIYEKKAMNKILDELRKDYPFYRKRLLKMKTIKKVEYDEEIKNDMMSLFENKYSIRPVRQYGGMAQVCKDYAVNADLGVIKGDDLCHKLTHKHIGNGSFILKPNKIVNYGTLDCKLDINNCENYFKIYRYFRFPFLHLNKKEIYLKSIKENWNKYLEYTWSCWFPQNGKPCGRCAMCKERVIPQRSLD